MKILFISYTFHPAVGGIESSAQLLLREFKQRNCQIVVVTHTPLRENHELSGFDIHRRPTLSTQLQLARWADIIYHHNPAFSFWIPFLSKRPIVFSIHTWVTRTDGRISWKDRLKQKVLSRYPCIANSRATAAHLPGPSTVIENAYDDEIFTNQTPWNQRNGAAFVGRLVSDKGVPTVLEAIAKAKQQGLSMPFKIIGSGPDQEELQEQSDRLGIGDEVVFLGRLDPEQINAELNQVKYLLVPSKWAEPFGIVALEGIASGCIPIGTNQGGLVDAIGKCGPLFDKDQSDQLAKLLIDLETHPNLVEEFRKHHPDHLNTHSPRGVADQYLKVFRTAIATKKKLRGRK